MRIMNKLRKMITGLIKEMSAIPRQSNMLRRKIF